jgi:hypothetical protein
MRDDCVLPNRHIFWGGAVLLSIVVLSATSFFIVRNVPTTDVNSPVGKLDLAIRELRERDHSANVHIKRIVSEQIQSGTDFSSVHSQLLQDGYEISFVGASPVDKKGRVAVAEKRVCPGFSRLTGFCDLVRVIITVDAAKIIDTDGYLLFQSP